MTLVFQLNGFMVRAMCVLAVIIVCAMALAVSTEVVLRMFSFPSIVGLIELTEYGLFVSTFFMAPHLLRTNEHIRVDIVMSRIDPAKARAVEFGVLVTIMLICVVTGIVGVSVLLDSVREGSLVFKDLIIPKWWLDWIIPLTALVLGLQALELLVAHARAGAAGDPAMSTPVPGIRPEELP
jgi:TRAP-type transport system small permease protein